MKQRSINTLGFQKRETECVLTEDKTILRLKTAQWPYIWEHKLVTKVEKINYFVTGTSKTHGELKRGDQTRTFMFENIHNNLNRQTAVSHLSLLIDYSV